MTVPYNKPPKTYQELVSLLQYRGLSVPSNDNAVKFLQRVNYYRFSAYCIPFQLSRDIFVSACTFEKIVELYKLDEALRNAVLALLSPIEIFLRTRIVYELSHRWGPFAHYDMSLFRSPFNHTEWRDSLEKEVTRAKETFIDHYLNTYDGFPKLPLWMGCEVMSIGSLSQLYSGLRQDPQRSICSVFDVHHEVFRSWMRFISYLRNVCAHQGRLWNRELAIRPELPWKNPMWSAVGLDNSRLFAGIAVLEWTCRKGGLPLEKVESVYSVMRDISAMDSRFSGSMGVPDGKPIGMCWEGLP